MAEPDTVFEPPEKRRVVLIPFDDSDHSKRAFEFYLSTLHKDGDFVIIMNVPESPSVQSLSYQYPYEKVDYAAKFEQDLKNSNEKSEECLKKCGEQLCTKFNDNNFRLLKYHGKPGEMIVHMAKEEQADIIVMGSRGLGVIRRTFLGSVSEYVLHHAHLPVVIVH